MDKFGWSVEGENGTAILVWFKVIFFQSLIIILLNYSLGLTI